MIGEGMDPVPFISAAYGCAALLLLSYAYWQLRLRKRLRQLQEVAEQTRLGQ